LQRLLQTRAPVSRVVGVVDETAIFCFNESARPLHYAAELDTLVCMELENKHLKLFDVVSPCIPSLDALLKRIPAPVEEIALHFSPDLLFPEALATPYIFDHDGPSYLMVRGPLAAEGHPFTLPRSARA
ncbi:GCN5-related N-acetyltransferase, partial [Candidatus Eisenbacteria bacterium]